MTDRQQAIETPSLGHLQQRRAMSQSPGRRTLRRFLSHRLAVLGATILAVMAICAILAPIIAPAPPNKIDLLNISKPPSAQHLLGTDAVGRDVLSRLLYGSRISLTVGVVAVAIYLVIGFVLGAVAGYFGGWIDTAIMRFTDVMLCFPTFVLILILVGILGPNIGNVILVIGLFGWPGVARLVRGQVLQLRTLDYVIAAQMSGGKRFYVLIRHILPNVVAPLIVAGTLGVAGAILTEAGLSFLGLGVVQPTPSWGSMLNEARNPALMAAKPWLWLAPGVTISLAVLATNFIGDGLRDAFDVKGSSWG
jgi:peptide/nickel transport system permease protein